MAIPFPYSTGGHGINRGSITLRDAKGNTSTMRYYLNSNGDTAANAVLLAASLQTTWAAMSNAALQASQGFDSVIGVAQYGAQADYQDITMKAVLVFQDSAGGLHRFQVPAPKVSIFLADRQTVDPANTDVAAFIAAMGATGSPPASPGVFVSTRTGEYFANYMGGFFRAAKIRRRSNVLILTPSLTPGEPEE